MKYDPFVSIGIAVAMTILTITGIVSCSNSAEEKYVPEETNAFPHWQRAAAMCAQVCAHADPAVAGVSFNRNVCFCRLPECGAPPWQ